jgi:hypothetical protein
MEALPLAEAIQRFAAGHKIRRLTLFENLGRSPESGPSRQLITNSNQYGLTKGGYNAEYLELTEDGKLASGDESLGRARLAARLELAITRIEPFNVLYERYRDNRLPTLSLLRDFVIERGVPANKAGECVETFLANSRDLRLARNYAGAERLLTFELLLAEIEAGTEIDLESRDDANGSDLESPTSLHIVPPLQPSSAARVLAETSDLSNVCFLISPIGGEGTEQRKHANLVLTGLRPSPTRHAVAGLGGRAPVGGWRP